MAKINFKLKAMRSVTVRALNGKLYNLKAGMNSFELEYNDYAALLKALGMKPMPEKKEAKQTKAPDPIKVEELAKDASAIQSDVPSVEEPANEPEVPADEPLHEPETLVDESINESEPAQEQEALADEPGVKEDSKEVDYASMSYTKLKAEYKRITGKPCKLKKDELIQFLQEHRDA